jgi:hypothetical protein
MQCDAISVYQSSFLDNEDEDKMVRGFRQVLDIIITSVAKRQSTIRSQLFMLPPGMISFLFQCPVCIWFHREEAGRSAGYDRWMGHDINEWACRCLFFHYYSCGWDLTGWFLCLERWFEKRIGIPPTSVPVSHQIHSLTSSNVTTLAISKEPHSRNHPINPIALHQLLHIFPIWLSSLQVVHSSRLPTHRTEITNQNSSWRFTTIGKDISDDMWRSEETGE